MSGRGAADRRGKGPNARPMEEVRSFRGARAAAVPRAIVPRIPDDVHSDICKHRMEFHQAANQLVSQAREILRVNARLIGGGPRPTELSSRFFDPAARPLTSRPTSLAESVMMDRTPILRNQWGPTTRRMR